ncbi:hypothetical protein CesoFtcFv8_018591 [Champsocephalus esox]|uniref:Uncharacterized protein n=1 Tax=Champsocephalus esox TaxID=159716 RepID=A0AAN8BH17_9TELE|nr:hypothetical protein CesoFtcFv8_018591 [Champsocephalus esox]
MNNRKGVASPTHPALGCAVVRSQSRGLQQIISPPGSRTQHRAAEHREPASSRESAEHMPFRVTQSDSLSFTHLANGSGKGFI